ncbi:MAG: hypothetical protein K0B08_02540 [Bacteroidales bacterium]|nr:hypothetical protein [Bacteroidales bacterium]
MKKKLQHFFLRLIAISLILAVIAFILKALSPAGTLPPMLPYLFILFIIVSAVVHWILLRITSVKPEKFISYFMMATMIKLIIYFVTVLAYVFMNQTGILSFIIAFFVLYIVYTVFEVTSILRQVKE